MPQDFPDQSALLAAVIRSALDCIILVDERGRVLEFNPAAEKTFGWSRAEAAGRPISSLIVPGELRAAHDAGFAAYMSGGPAKLIGRRVETRARDKTGRLFPVELTLSEVAVDGRRIFAASLRDLSARHAADEELARSREALHQSQKLAALGSLLAGVSHELNNPLSAVIGQAEMLEEDSAGTPLEARAKRVAAAAQRCARIVASFLAMARHRPPRRRPLDLNAQAKRALELTDYALRTAGIAVEITLDPDLPRVEADEDQLQQVLVNLLVNAQQAMEAAPCEAHRWLHLRSSASGDGAVVLEIADSGPGVQADVAGRIFDPFFTTKPNGGGTGIGLSLSRGIVESHGGTLTLEPSSRGAVFVLRLPAAGGEAAEATAAAPTRSAQSGRALVVDDEEDVAETLAEMLAREGFVVERARDGEAALAAVASGRIDLIFSDLRMPGLSGLAFHERLAAERPAALSRLAFVTGDTIGPGVADFLARCGRPVLEKPVTRAALRALLSTTGGKG